MNSKKDIELLCFKFEKKLSNTPNAIIRVDMIIDYCRNNYSSIKNILHLVDKGINLSEEEGYNRGVAALKIYIAFDLWYTNKHKHAVEIINQYNHQLLASNFYFEYALAQNIVSLIAWSRGELENAFETIFEGLDKVKGKKGNHSALARMNMTLAVLYYDLNELDLSYSHYKLCRKKLRECKIVYDYGTDIYSLIGLASIYKQQKAYKKSKKLLEESLNLSCQYNMWMTVARAQYELGCIEMLIGNDTNAIKLISKSYDIRKAHNTSASMVSCLYKLGELNLKLKKLDVAKEKLFSALIICKKEKLIPKQASIFLLLAKVFEFENDFESAYTYLQRYNALAEKGDTSKSYHKTKYLQYIYKTKKAEKESENQRKINAQLKEANEIITKQKNDISDKNAEKDMLLKEIHHRVKNNLQIITSLLSLQSMGIEDKGMKDLFMSSQNRINSMALIHEMLYQSENISRINYRDYLIKLINRLVSISKGQNHKIEISIDTPEFFLNVDAAIPLGLLINEIITNSLKYGIIESEGRLFIKIVGLGSYKYMLTIGDDGSGYSDDINWRTVNSLGLKLIHKLAKQLKGKIEKDKKKNGTSYILTFMEIQH